ncbi:MAG: hypothetical protein DMF88_14530 [Acidobacteria bacterium]|nr:MAG: hypothetical protein DMF88_14530 [Acidobacteriota bacterium]
MRSSTTFWQTSESSRYVRSSGEPAPCARSVRQPAIVAAVARFFSVSSRTTSRSSASGSVRSA